MGKKKEEVKQEEVVEQPQVNADYAFMVVASENQFTVRPLPEGSGVAGPETMDDIYNACHTVCRNINNQQLAQTIGAQMAAVAQQARNQAEVQEVQRKLHVPKGVRGK